MSSDPQRKTCPPLWPCLLVCAAAALWIDFGSLHRRHHADSLLPAMISLYRWTPFYWDLDRIGMLVPLIARPVRHPLFNLLMQDALYVFSALAALVLLPRYLLRNAVYPLAGLLSVAAFLALAPEYYRFEYLVDTQYGVWLFLGLSSLILLEPSANGPPSWPRQTAAAALMVLAHWVYCTATMFLGSLIVFRAIFFWQRTAATDPRDDGRRPPYMSLARSELVRSLVVLAIGFFAGLALMRLAPIHDTDFASLPPSDWPRTWQNLATSAWTALAPQWWPWFLLLAAAIGMIAQLLPAVRERTKTSWRAAAAATAAAILIGLFIGTRHWVAANGHAFRFLLPSTLMLQAALLGIAVAPLGAIASAARRNRVSLAMAPLVIVAAALSYGRPSLGGVYRDLDPYYDAVAATVPPPLATRELLDSGCTHVAGDYWKVWPAVFRANLALYEQGERRVVWGVSERSGPTHRYWSAVPRDRMRVAVAAGGDPQAEIFLDHYRLAPLSLAEKRDSLWLLRPAELARPAAVSTTRHR
ncbi:MAG TPA: hypothetical protein VGN42_24905 [Pirellulales bacterium]|nr:hypothetical protein [Pirellulales bacterium]